jgi:Reverse transcriptase (RNA-dependent DNA polymerase)/RNase H-like domain found in reverse transcriptase/Integrase zinc binding domain
LLIPFPKDIIIEPRQSTEIMIDITFIMPKSHRGLVTITKPVITKKKVSVKAAHLIEGRKNTKPIVILSNQGPTKATLKARTDYLELFIFPVSVANTISKKKQDFSKLDKLSSKLDLSKMTQPNLTKTQINLLEMAAQSNLSATSYALQVESQPIQCLVVNIPNFRNSLDRKLYCTTYINNYRVMTCIDSGSDVTILQYRHFSTIFKEARDMLDECDFQNIKSFSEHNVKVVGQITCYVRFSPRGPSVPITIIVIQDISVNVPTLLFGNDSFKACLATLAYTGNKNDPTPEFMVHIPRRVMVPIVQASPLEIFTCVTKYTLQPYETQDIDFMLHVAAPVIRTDEILITSICMDLVNILPSKTDITFDYEKNCFVGRGCVVNLTNNIMEGEITGKFEILGSYNQYDIREDTRSALRIIMKKNPPVREIYPSKKDLKFQIPIPTIHATSVKLKQNVKHESTENTILEPDLNIEKDVLGGSKVTYTGEADISPQIIETGLEIPTLIHKTPEEALNLKLFEPEFRPYLQKIFLEKYPNVVSLHSLDAGDVSKTLGFTSLRLIPGENLPRHKRIYQLSPNDATYLEQLLEQFIRFNYVRRAPIESTDLHLYGMSTYLVPRKKLTDIARLVIDFSPLTSIIQSPPSIVPDISASLQQLQGKALFSAMDLRYAYLALKIDEPSKPLTTFLTPGGAYQWLSIPTGAACSPAYFIDAVNRILHYKPVLDENGEPVFESKNKVKLERDVMSHSFHYFDDIVCSTEPKKTYKETLDYHFECLEKIISRLSFHNVKLSVNKSEFAKSKILFLGWIVSHDFIIPDPRRMEKIKNAQFPKSKKEVRSFIGLVNSIRRVVPFEVIKQIQILTPLTSSSKLVEFKPEKKHHEAFEIIKSMLLAEPLFCNLINEKSTKYLWVDAASSSGCLGAVLAQRIDPNEKDNHLPTYIDLEDPVHRIIYDNNYPYEPCKIYTDLPISLPKPKELKTIPPNIKKRERFHGFTEKNVHDSLFWSVISIYTIYGCKLPSSTLELRSLAVKEIKKGILGIKLKDQSFNNNHMNYRQFLQEFENGLHNIDKDWLLVEALAKATYRCMIFLSNLEEHQSKPVFKFNHESTKPPLIFGVYREEGKIVFTPYFYNKNLEFNIDNLKGKIQIVAYLAKSVPDTFRSRSILDLEVFAILTALHSLQRYISNTKCHLLTDSRVLYYLFNQKVGDSSTKIRRWVLKLLSDYPLITLHFIRTTENLADYLTRQGLPKGDLEKFSLKNVIIEDFYDKLPQESFTLTEWVRFCTDNPQYLTINQPNVNMITMTINQGIQNITDLTDPINILKERLSRENIIEQQHLQFAPIIEKCLENEDFTYNDENDEKQHISYKMILSLLLININEKDWKIYIPDSMIGLLLAYTHMIGHWSTNKMIKNLQEYHFNNMYSTVKRFVSCCYSCFLQNSSSRQNKLGLYPIPDYPFQEISMDLCENLNKVNGYSHLLVLQDVLSDFTLVFPLKSKTNAEMSRIFLYSVLQNFNIRRIHTDNGPVFRNANWLKLMAALNITVINSSSQNPSSRGKAEKAVHTVKTILKKLLATSSSGTLNWEYLPFITSKIINHTIVPRTGFTPMQMIVGRGPLSNSFLDSQPLLSIHHSIANHKIAVDNLSKEVVNMTDSAKKKLLEIKVDTHTKLNKNKIDKKFRENDIVFVLDRYNIPGNTRPLKTKYYSSPCIVLQPYYTTTLIQRISDGFKALYSNDDLKKYSGGDPLFKNLPKEISNILLHDFCDFLSQDLTTIIKYDPLDLPTGLNLKDTVETNYVKDDVNVDIDNMYTDTKSIDVNVDIDDMYNDTSNVTNNDNVITEGDNIIEILNPDTKNAKMDTLTRDIISGKIVDPFKTIKHFSPPFLREGHAAKAHKSKTKQKKHLLPDDDPVNATTDHAPRDQEHVDLLEVHEAPNDPPGQEHGLREATQPPNDLNDSSSEEEEENDNDSDNNVKVLRSGKRVRFS